MASYAEFVGTTTAGGGLIRDWANRDAEVLSQAVVHRCIQWAADRCYKTLRIPPLEFTRRFTIESGDLARTYGGAGMILTMPVPEDMIELIYIRRPSDQTVFNFRLDNRSLNDSYSEIQFNSFTRIGDDFFIYGDVSATQEIEIHYYRRLPALNATYDVTAENYNAGFVTGGTRVATTTELAGSQFYIVAANRTTTGTAYSTFVLAMAADTADTTIYSVTGATGTEVRHWLRDENERILLYGALIEAFNYLGEIDAMERYVALFDQEITRLNTEEKMRDTRGGNIQVSYNGGGLL